jgi:hypothetical protein
LDASALPDVAWKQDVVGFREPIVFRTNWLTAAAAIAISSMGVFATLPL